MRLDLTRSTFRPERIYSGVVQQQGRVQLDADWNEAVDIAAHTARTSTGDVVGACGVPREAPGFGLVGVDGELLLSPGRIYVGGVCCELSPGALTFVDTHVDEDGRLVGGTLDGLVLDGRPVQQGDWVQVRGAGGDGGGGGDGDLSDAPVAVATVDADTRHVELTSPVTVPAGAVQLRRWANVFGQPWLPPPAVVRPPAPEGDAVDTELPDGTYLAYLDVWERAVTALEDANLRDPALGGPDTAARTQVVWQVRLHGLDSDSNVDIRCDTLPSWDELGLSRTGRLAAQAEPETTPDDDCDVPPGAGYRRLENQLYRVEVHDPGPAGAATFKWSRENASVVARWQATHGKVLKVAETGGGAVTAFAPGDWVELTDRDRELTGTPGVFVLLAGGVEEGELPVKPDADPVPDDGSIDRADFGAHAVVRRWDARTPPATIPDDDGWVDLEDGVQVRFDPSGTYRTGDWWLVPARTATGDVDWPSGDAGDAIARPPAGPVHRYCSLAVVHVRDGEAVKVRDCRPQFPPLTDLRADDVGFDNERCDLPAADTVQEALDALCRQRDLRFHNKHLHGWGIVCGLQVVCASSNADEERRSVTVRPGYALDCEGRDLVLDADHDVDVLGLAAQLAKSERVDVLDRAGNGEVCLELKGDGADISVVGARHEPDRARAGLLEGTLLGDFVQDCVHPLAKAFLTEVHDSGGAARNAALISVAAQLTGSNAATIYLSRDDHDELAALYGRLREVMASKTFCALLDGLGEFPDYPEALARADRDTRVAVGRHHHGRLRLRGDLAEAFTAGTGLDPRQPKAVIDRYDLDTGELLESMDVLAGAAADVEIDSGAGAVADVAFSPDGERIHVAIPAAGGNDTFVRSGHVSGRRSVRWGPLTTVCGVRLVTLATTEADPDAVWAAGLGQGLYRLDPDDVATRPEPVAAFDAFGHLEIDDHGVAFATVTSEQPDRYDRVRRVPVGATRQREAVDHGREDRADAPGNQSSQELAVPPGSDDIALARRGKQICLLTVAEGPGKSVVAMDAISGEELGRDDIDDTAVRLATTYRGDASAPTVLAVGEDLHGARVYDLGDLADPNTTSATVGFVPAQAGPVSIATDARGRVAMLNGMSGTVISYQPGILTEEGQVPAAALAEYRQRVVAAFAELLGRALQYLKDCLCDHLLVDCPTCEGDERIMLACVSVRGWQVERVCNFSQRRYVMSFPTLGYWTSLVPLVPVLSRAVQAMCGMVLTGWGDRVAPPGKGPAPPTRQPAPQVSGQALRAAAAALREGDPQRWLRDLSGHARTLATMLAGGLTAPERAKAATAPSTDRIAERPAERVEHELAARDVAVDHEPFAASFAADPLSAVMGLLRTPKPGGRVRLFEDAGTVKGYEVREPEAATAVQTEVDALRDTLAEREAEINELREAVTRLDERHQALAQRLDQER